MARRTRRRRLAVAVLPAVATAVALATGVGQASANTTTTTFTYTDNSNLTHTCTINLTRTYPFGGDNQVGEGGTSTSGGLDCTDGVISYIGATWNDPDGESMFAVENSDGQSTTRRYAPIGSDFVTQHKRLPGRLHLRGQPQVGPGRGRGAPQGPSPRRSGGR
jgi:hypothetical protein